MSCCRLLLYSHVWASQLSSMAFLVRFPKPNCYQLQHCKIAVKFIDIFSFEDTVVVPTWHVPKKSFAFSILAVLTSWRWGNEAQIVSAYSRPNPSLRRSRSAKRVFSSTFVSCCITLTESDQVCFSSLLSPESVLSAHMSCYLDRQVGTSLVLRLFISFFTADAYCWSRLWVHPVTNGGNLVTIPSTNTTSSTTTTPHTFVPVVEPPTATNSLRLMRSESTVKSFEIILSHVESQPVSTNNDNVTKMCILRYIR